MQVKYLLMHINPYDPFGYSVTPIYLHLTCIQPAFRPAFEPNT